MAQTCPSHGDLGLPHCPTCQTVQKVNVEARKPRHRSARHGQSRRAVASLVLVGAVAGAGILYWHTHPGNETVETWLSDWMEHGNVIKVSDVSCTNTGQTVTDGGEVFDCVMSVVQRSRNRKIDYTYRMSVTAFTVEDMTGNRGIAHPDRLR